MYPNILEHQGTKSLSHFVQLTVKNWIKNIQLLLLWEQEKVDQMCDIWLKNC